MKNLQQAVYEDDNGREFPAEKVDCLAPYTHIADGFYHWTCGSCGEDHSDRWWNISGRVVKCGDGRSEALGEHRISLGCGKMNLLVRTNTTDVTEALSGKWKSAEMEAENERLKGITKYNIERVREVERHILNALSTSVSTAVYKAEQGK